MPVRRVIEQAARIYGIPAEHIVGRRRLRSIVQARHAVCLAALDAGWASPHIGRILGGRDHSTVLSGCDAAACLEQRSPDYAAKLGQLRRFASSPADAPYIGEPAAPILFAKAKRERAVARLMRAPRDDADSRDERLFFRSVSVGSSMLLAAIRREHPERCTA